MPEFGFSKSFGVGRGVKLFLDLKAGATRGKAANPGHPRNRAATPREKDQQIHRLKKQIKVQREINFQLENELRARNEPAGNDQDSLPVPGKPEEGAGSLPDFVVIGAMRCGTSQFYNLLTSHPFVRGAAAKELHYFDNPGRYRRGLGWYRKCFPIPESQDGQKTITGEATPKYLLDPRVPRRMARVIPEARLIALLRNPVDRAYSQYHLSVRNGTETRSFRETVEEELAWMIAGKDGRPVRERRSGADRGGRYNQLARGIYVDQLVRWRKFFDEEQMLVLKSEDLFQHTTATMEKVQDFLGLPYREIKLPSRRAKRKETPDYGSMDPTLRERLEAFFESHNRRLYDHLGRDFGW